MGIQTREELHQQIARLEVELLIERKALFSEANCALESINPLGPIKAIANKIKSYTPGNNTLDTIIGLGTGLIVKKLVHQKPGGIIKNIAALILQLGLTHKVSENKEAVEKLERELLNDSEVASY